MPCDSRYALPHTWTLVITYFLFLPKPTLHVYTTVRLIFLKYHFVNFDSVLLSFGQSFAVDPGCEWITGVLVYPFPEPWGHPAWPGTAGSPAASAWVTAASHHPHTHHRLQSFRAFSSFTPRCLWNMFIFYVCHGVKVVGNYWFIE